jgi:hypothetical protein
MHNTDKTLVITMIYTKQISLSLPPADVRRHIPSICLCYAMLSGYARLQAGRGVGGGGANG